MNEDLVAKLRAIKVRTPQEVMAEQEYKLVQPGFKELRSKYSWGEYWKTRGMELASMADLYAGFKVIHEMYNYGEPGRAYGLRKELKEDFLRGKWMATSTSINYLFGELEHDGSVYSKVNVDIPHFGNVRVQNVDSSSLDFLRALFKTSDSPHKIGEVMEFATSTLYVGIGTLPTDGVSRSESPLQSVGLYVRPRGFNPASYIDLCGEANLHLCISRGVRR